MKLSFDELYDLWTAGKAKDYLDSRTTKELKALAKNYNLASNGSREVIMRNIRVRLQERKMLLG